jgi:hypothetical protein
MMSRKFLLILGGILLTLFMGFVFWLLGFLISGNFFSDYEFLGLTGFSATVNLSLILGLLIGAIISIYLFMKYSTD